MLMQWKEEGGGRVCVGMNGGAPLYDAENGSEELRGHEGRRRRRSGLEGLSQEVPHCRVRSGSAELQGSMAGEASA